MRLFVYGTLKREGLNNRLFQQIGASFVGEATTIEKYCLYLSRKGVPRLYRGRGPSAQTIRGEVFDIPDNSIYQIDRLEGHPFWYKREIIDVLLNSGKAVKAWVYFFRLGLMTQHLRRR